MIHNFEQRMSCSSEVKNEAAVHDVVAELLTIH